MQKLNTLAKKSLLNIKPPFSATKVFSSMSVRDALNSAMDEEILRDPKVFLMGNLFYL